MMPHGEINTTPEQETPPTPREPTNQPEDQPTTSDNPMSYDEAMEETRKRFSAQLVGFDPTIIISIVSAIIQLLGNKKPSERSAQAVQDCCKRRPFAALVRLNLFMQRQGVSAKQRSQAAEAALKIGKEAKFEEVVAFCNCCDTLLEDEEGI